MPLSILVPVHLEAKIVSQTTKVASLTGAPFNENAALETGAHLHWALPDALTRVRFVEEGALRRTLLPGVPDLWLVVRFNPVPSGEAVIGLAPEPVLGRGGQPVSGRAAESAGPAKRSWRAWVVDSRSQTATPLEDWSAPAAPGPDSIHTFAGLLPSGAAIGAPGWGLWNNEEQGSFDPAAAAYYPTARGRFGFHDDLAGLSAAAGTVSYAVVGWYALPAHDPLYSSPGRQAQLIAWKWAWKSGNFRQMQTVVAAAGSSAAAPFVPSSTRSGNAPAGRVAAASDQARTFVRGGEERRQAQRLAAMRQSVGDLTLALSGDGPAAAVDAGQITGQPVPREIICHGAVVDVPLEPPLPEAEPFKPGDIRVYPSVKTAMAAVASLNEANKVEMVEALLQSLDGQMSKTQSGVIDLPAALHALTFQSAPGRSQFFAQIDIIASERVLQKAPSLTLSKAPADAPVAARRASGYWPQIATRSAAAPSHAITRDAIKGSLLRTPRTAKPYEPTDGEVGDWIDDVKAALKDAVAEAAAKGTPIDPEVVRVRDSRSRAQPILLGPTTDGRGSDGAGYWVDVSDPNPDAMRRLLIAAHGASVGLPDSDKLYELPGPRWYRPWSPHLVVAGHGRSFRFGEDGRFEYGWLRCRVSGETLTSVKAGSGKIVLARDIVGNTASLGAHAAVPPEARALIEETALLDAGNARTMASLSVPGATGTALDAAQKVFEDASHAVWLLRDPSLTAAHRTQILSLVEGREPSPVAFLPWRDPWDPLFVDVNYAHPFSSLETDWTLDGENDKPPSVEFRPLSAAATQPPTGQVELIDERSFLTSTIVHTLESAFITQMTNDKFGNPVKAGGASGNGPNAGTFKKMAVLSAPFTRFEHTLFNRGRRERTGALRLNRLDVVDAFGSRRSWDSTIPDPASTGGDETLMWWTALPPRLPFWSRLQFRLLSAENPDQDATFRDSPLCGFMLPDLFEHALEVFDASGRALGQLRSDPPQRGSVQATTLNAWFEVHPWTAAEQGMTADDDPLGAVSNARLRELVAGIAAQGGVVVPPNQPDHLLFETGLTALMRIIDTLRPSIDPEAKVKDRKVRLIGDPIAVFGVGTWLEVSEQTAPAGLKDDPQAPAQPPVIPTLNVRVGDQSRPDDGVYGCFLPGSEPAQSKFAPVDAEAADKAVLNQLPEGGDITQYRVQHSFVQGVDCVFPLAVGQKLDLTVLVEAGAGLHAVCGALPRKKISVPREFLAGVCRLEPTFRVGPLLSIPRLGGLSPILPTPQLEGHDVQWLRYEPGEEGNPGKWEADLVPPLPPVGSVPPERARISEGWMRLTRGKDAPK